MTEYNAKLRDKIEWISEYDENDVWNGSDDFGASLKSFQKLLEEKG